MFCVPSVRVSNIGGKGYCEVFGYLFAGSKYIFCISSGCFGCGEHGSFFSISLFVRLGVNLRFITGSLVARSLCSLRTWRYLSLG